MSTKKTKKYYDIEDDLKKYPDCWAFFIFSARGKGKTYSMLWKGIKDNVPLVYAKRTQDDVNLITSGNSLGFNTSPYVPINRDKGTNIVARKIRDGIGAFWHGDDDGEPVGEPVSYALALSGIKKYKGFDLSCCDYYVIDECIPQDGERVDRKNEFGQAMSLYKTISRDREARGRAPLKMIMLSNSETIACPLTEGLEIIDVICDMIANNENYAVTRGIMIHRITEEEYPMDEAEKGGIYEALKDTAWGRKSFGNEFPDDLSNVVHMSIKHMKCVYKITYKTHDYYIYQRADGFLYMTSSRSLIYRDYYNFNLENDYKRFGVELYYILRDKIITNQMKFQKYSMAHLIMNFKDYFKM